MAFDFVDFFAVVGLGPAPIDPPIPPPPPLGSSDVPNATKLAQSASVVRRRKNSIIRNRGVQCVATAHFYHFNDVECSDDAHGFSELFGSPLPPSILDAYPLSKNRDEIADALPQFCFPTGLYLSRSGALPTYFRIVLTDVQGSRMYATVLMFHDSVPCSALVSPTHPLAACTQMVYVPKCLTIISHWPFFDVFKQFLKFIYQASLTPSSLPLERFICNFVDEIPLPPPGRINVTFKLDQQELSLQRAPPNKIDIIDVDPRVVYLQLSHDVIARVFSLLLLEQKVLMLSSRFTSLSDVGDTLLSYLQPLVWEHVYIPILPTRLCEFLNAPTPFLMGCHIQVMEDLDIPEDVALLYIDENRLEMGGGRGHFASIPSLPEKRHKNLLRRLSEAMAPSPQPSSGFIQLMEMAFPIAAPPSSEADDGSQDLGEEGDLSNRALIQNSFYQCLVSLLVRYSEFMIPVTTASTRPAPEVSSRETYSDDRASMIDRNAALPQFRFKEFLAANPSPFMQMFLATSVFSRFVEDRHEMTPERLQKIQLFDEHIICKQNRSNVWFKKKQTPFINDQKYEVMKSEFAPPPSLAGIDPQMVFKYDRFPALSPEWFTKKRHMHVISDAQEAEWTDTDSLLATNSSSRTLVTKRMREFSFSSWIQVQCAIADVQSLAHVKDVGSAVFLVYEGMKRFSLKPQDSAMQAIISMFRRIEDPDTLLHALHAIKANGITIDPLFYRVLPTALSPERPEADGHGMSRQNSFVKKPLPPTPLPPSAPAPISSKVTLLLGCACPACAAFISASDIKSSWTSSAAGVGWGYMTLCPKCKHSFVARFLVTITGSEPWSGWAECMSPVVVHGEINSLLEEWAAAPAAASVDVVTVTFLSNLRSNHSSVFWNLVWHCCDIKATTEFMLPGMSVHLSSARDPADHRTPAIVDADGAAAALQAAAISAAVSDERNSFIPTITLVEFEQESQDTRKQPHMQAQQRSSESSRPPAKPLPLPSSNVKVSTEAPTKSLPPLPSAATPLFSSLL